MFASLLRIFALMVKELRVLWEDPGSRRVLIVPIIVQCLIFGYGVTFNLERVPYVLFDESASPQSAQLVMALEGSGYFRRELTCFDEPCFLQAMDRGAGLVGLHFAPDFAVSAELNVIADARNTTSANTAAAYLTEAAALLLQRSDVQPLFAPWFAEAEAKRQAAGRPALSFTYRYYYNENNITRFGILTGMILGLSAIQVIILAALTVAREREDGTFDMLLMTPANSLEILIGKALPPAMAATGQSLILTAICTFWFDIPCRGSLLLLLLVIALFSLAVVGIGLAISAVVSNAQQAATTAFLTVLPCVILSGMLTPDSAVAPWFRFVLYINPLYYGIQAVQRIYLEGAGFFDIWHLLLPFGVFGLITMPAAMYLFRHRLT